MSAKIQRKPDARDSRAMTHKELRARMEWASLDTEELAARLGVSRRTVQWWLAGKGAVPYLAAYAVRHL